MDCNFTIFLYLREVAWLNQRDHMVMLLFSARATFVIDKSNHTIDALCFPCTLCVFALFIDFGKSVKEILTTGSYISKLQKID